MIKFCICHQICIKTLKTMNVIKILIKNTFIISFITFIMFETFGFFLSKINVIPSGSPAVISLFADKNFAVWHPKNMKFKHHYNTCWDPSYVTFNNIGARSTKDYYETKTKKRIALLGDSMIEMIHVNDNYDIGSLLSKNLKKFEILNFSARSMGLFDQIKIYRKMVRNYNVDHVIIFITENDLENNYVKDLKVFNPTRETFYVENDIIKKKPYDESWYNSYNSSINKFKRSKLMLLVKEYSYTFKVYFHIKTLLRQKKTINQSKNISEKEFNILYSEIDNQAKVYKYLIQKFIKDIEKDNVNLYVVMNLRNYLFEKVDPYDFREILRKKHFEKLLELWQPHKPYFFYKEANEFIRQNQKKITGNFKNLGHVCDDHYSKFGAKFLSDQISGIFK